jgi:hypothetical protein
MDCFSFRYLVGMDGSIPGRCQAEPYASKIRRLMVLNL